VKNPGLDATMEKYRFGETNVMLMTDIGRVYFVYVMQFYWICNTGAFPVKLEYKPVIAISKGFPIDSFTTM